MLYLPQQLSSAPQEFGKSFFIEIDIKALGKIKRKALLAELPCFYIPPCLCDVISIILAGQNIFSAVVDSSYSCFHSVITGGPQSSVFSPTIFFLFICDLFQRTFKPLQS